MLARSAVGRAVLVGGRAREARSAGLGGPGTGAPALDRGTQVGSPNPGHRAPRYAALGLDAVRVVRSAHRGPGTGGDRRARHTDPKGSRLEEHRAARRLQMTPRREKPPCSHAAAESRRPAESPGRVPGHSVITSLEYGCRISVQSAAGRSGSGEMWPAYG